MDAALTKTRTVLHLIGDAHFVHLDDEVGNLRRHHVHLEPQVWDDMGRPDTITVTIEPGDHLNGPED